MGPFYSNHILTYDIALAVHNARTLFGQKKEPNRLNSLFAMRAKFMAIVSITPRPIIGALKGS